MAVSPSSYFQNITIRRAVASPYFPRSYFKFSYNLSLFVFSTTQPPYSLASSNEAFPCSIVRTVFCFFHSLVFPLHSTIFTLSSDAQNRGLLDIADHVHTSGCLRNCRTLPPSPYTHLRNWTPALQIQETLTLLAQRLVTFQRKVSQRKYCISSLFYILHLALSIFKKSSTLLLLPTLMRNYFSLRSIPHRNAII